MTARHIKGYFYVVVGILAWLFGLVAIPSYRESIQPGAGLWFVQVLGAVTLFSIGVISWGLREVDHVKGLRSSFWKIVTAVLLALVGLGSGLGGAALSFSKGEGLGPVIVICLVLASVAIMSATIVFRRR
ncbi:MAG: hypothetical protein IT285_13875 [Bdellovibrionales bacterium]|nr:hypothetical protein [Bdellovibrionales bacterium]